jgi:ectoine hydroxylase-related dioxygenase (phytanoyl-CoA dioxygenase family)
MHDYLKTSTAQRETSGNCETFSNSESLRTTPTQSTSPRQKVISTSPKVTENNIHNILDAAKKIVETYKAKCNSTANVPEPDQQSNLILFRAETP